MKKIKVDGGGQRHDQGKIRIDLLPADVLREFARVMTFGAGKYAERNWERGMPWSKAYGPLTRHLNDWVLARHRMDPESRCKTMAHVLCNAAFLLAWELRGMQRFDDVEPFARGFNRTKKK